LEYDEHRIKQKINDDESINHQMNLHLLLKSRHLRKKKMDEVTGNA